MKRTVWFWIVSAVVMVGLGASSCQQGKKTTSRLFLNNAYAANSGKSTSSVQKNPTLLSTKGEITGVDVKKLTFTLKEEGKDTSIGFSTDEKTVQGLLVGEKVEVLYKKLPDGTYRAVSVKKVVTPTVAPQTTPKK